MTQILTPVLMNNKFLTINEIDFTGGVQSLAEIPQQAMTIYNVETLQESLCYFNFACLPLPASVNVPALLESSLADLDAYLASTGYKRADASHMRTIYNDTPATQAITWAIQGDTQPFIRSNLTYESRPTGPRTTPNTHSLQVNTDTWSLTSSFEKVAPARTLLHGSVALGGQQFDFNLMALVGIDNLKFVESPETFSQIAAELEAVFTQTFPMVNGDITVQVHGAGVSSDFAAWHTEFTKIQQSGLYGTFGSGGQGFYMRNPSLHPRGF